MQQYRKSERTIYIFILKKQRKGNCCNQIKKLGNKMRVQEIFFYFLSQIITAEMPLAMRNSSSDIRTSSPSTRKSKG